MESRNVIHWTRVFQFIEGGEIKYVPYNNLFERVENMDVLKVGVLAFK